MTSIIDEENKVIKFCEIMDSFPIDFRFKLTNTGKGLDGTLRKRTFNGATAWQKGSKLLFNSSFYPFRKRVFEDIEKGGYSLGEKYFPDTRRKIVPLLSKQKIKELYYGQKKSLQIIAREYGWSRQWIMALMEKYKLKRRTLSRARIEAIKQGRG
jgi:NDP-sugar pyrophosphorylase family protein